MLRDPAFFWRPNNTASRGRRRKGRIGRLRSLEKMPPKNAIFSTVLSKIVALAGERKPYRIRLLFTHENGDFGAISVTEQSQPPPQALRFSHGRGERETSDWWWTARDHGKGSSRLPLRAHFHEKRDVWVRGRSKAAPRWSQKWSITYWINSVPYLSTVWTGTGTVPRVNKQEQELESTEKAENIQEWGLRFREPNPLGQPLRHNVKSVWTTSSSSVPIPFRVSTKSYRYSVDLSLEYQVSDLVSSLCYLAFSIRSVCILLLGCEEALRPCSLMWQTNEFCSLC